MANLKKKLWVLLIAVMWVLCMAHVVAELSALMSGDQKNEGNALAQVISTSGELLYRPYNSLIWFTASPHQKFYENEIIAVPENSTSRLAIYHSHRIELKPGSMIRLGTDPSAGRRLPEIELLNGEIDVTGGEQATDVKEQFRYIARGEKPPVENQIVVRRGTSALTVGSQAKDSAKLIASNNTDDLIVGAVKGTVVSNRGAPVKKDPPQVIAKQTTKPRFTLLTATSPTPPLMALNIPVPVSLKPKPKMAPPPARPKRPRLAAVAPKYFKVPEIEVEKPKIEAPIVPQLVAKNAPSLAGPATKSFWYVNEKIWPTVSVTLAAPAEIPQRPDFSVFVEVSGGGLMGQQKRMYGPQGNLQPPFNINSKLLRKIAGDQDRVTIRSGIVTSPDAPALYAATEHQISLRSLNDWQGRPVTVYLQRLLSPNGKTANLMRESLNKNFPYAVTLRNGSQLQTLLGAMRSGFRLAPGDSKPGEERLRFIQSGQQLATMSGPRIPPQVVKGLIRNLGAQFAYRGTVADVLTMPPGNRNRLAYLAKHLKSNENVKVISRDRFVVLTNEQWEEQLELVRPIAISSEYMFATDIPVVLP